MPCFLENARRPWQPFDVTFFNMDNGIIGGYTKEKIALRRAISLGTDVRAGQPYVLAQEVDQVLARRNTARQARPVQDHGGFDEMLHRLILQPASAASARPINTRARCSLLAADV